MEPHGRTLGWQFSPLELLRRWPTDRQALLLHSGRPDPKWARWSIMAEPVGTYQFIAHPALAPDHQPLGQSRWIGPEDLCPVEAFSHKPFTDLRRLLNASKGIWIGYLGYDLGRWIERLPTPYSPQADRSWPVIELSYCPGYLVHDHITGTWSACGAWEHTTPAINPEAAHNTPAIPGFTALPPRSALSQSEYEYRVAQVKDYIASGDVFQVNLAHRFTTRLFQDSPVEPYPSTTTRTLFEQLTAVSPAWYGAYLELPGVSPPTENTDPQTPAVPRRAIASTSPELFLQVNHRRITTRPVKGTRPASVSPNELRHSEKDTAELNMIIDLMRNDLGRVCDYGSVRVTQPRTIESHPTVHHGVATIEGRLHPSKDIVDLLRATLPGGSVTGTPKVRAMQIIDQLEPVPRGPYCGCIGYLSRDAACLNIAIRTMLTNAHTGLVDFSVGAGIVADSQPRAEYQETLDKAAAMISALQTPIPAC